MTATDVLVIGGGILGLAHAYEGLQRGMTVRLVERDPTPVGASIRNFGMIWPIGQPAGALLELAMRGRDVWLDLAGPAGFECRPCGSLFLAHQEDERRVLEEFLAREAARPGRDLRLLSPDEVASEVPMVHREELQCALWSGSELGIDPREAVPRLLAWLIRESGLVREQATAIRIEGNCAQVADGRAFEADRIIVCTGADIDILYPGLLERSGVVKCKLQMVRTAPQPAGWRLGCHLAAGLTLCHYESFGVTDAVEPLRDRFRRMLPEYVDNGIHVLVAQNPRCELVIGDSHHHAAAARTPFDSRRVEALILAYLQRMIVVPDPTPVVAWHGVYARMADGRPYLVAKPEPAVTVVNGIGGAGMTLSFGLAARIMAGALP